MQLHRQSLLKIVVLKQAKCKKRRIGIFSGNSIFEYKTCFPEYEYLVNILKTAGQEKLYFCEERSFFTACPTLSGGFQSRTEKDQGLLHNITAKTAILPGRKCHLFQLVITLLPPRNNRVKKKVMPKVSFFQKAVHFRGERGCVNFFKHSTMVLTTSTSLTIYSKGIQYQSQKYQLQNRANANLPN